MPAVEARIDRLEEALASYLEESRRLRLESREEMRAMHERDARTDEQLLRMQQQAEKDRQRADKDREQANKDRERAETNRQQDRQESETNRQQAEMSRQQDRQEAERSRQQDRQEMETNRQQAETSRQQDRQEAERSREQDQQEAERNRQEDRQKSEKERRDFNRRMAELSDSTGTLVEDMVVPNAERIAAQIFGDDPALDISQRVRRRRGGESMELDLLAAGTRNVMVVESKRRIRPEDTDNFLLKLQRLPEFFPEYANYRIVPVLASVTIEPSVIANLTRRKVYGLAFGDETMELVNAGQF